MSCSSVLSVCKVENSWSCKRNGKTRQDKTRQDKTRQDKRIKDSAGSDDTASMNEGGAYNGACTRQLPTTKTT